MKCNLPVKTLKKLVPAFHKIAISRKTKYLVQCNFFSSKARLFGIIQQSSQKESSNSALYSTTLKLCFLAHY